MRPFPALVVAVGILATLVCLAGWLGAVTGTRWHGRPFAIDGDTLRAGGERLRLLGIDAPELDQTCGASGEIACGRRARDALAALVAGGVRCESHGRDVYRRRLVRCRTEDGTDLAASLVAAGEALAEGCCQIEQGAAWLARRGLWAAPFERPVDWRRRHQAGRTAPDRSS